MPKIFASKLPEDLDTSTASARRLNWDRSLAPERHRKRVVMKEGAWAEAYAELLALLEGDGVIAVLTGKRGIGKTQLAVEAMRAFCLSGYTARYAKAAEMFLAIREGMSSEKSERAAMKPYLTPHLLVLDAMEERGETPWEDRTFNYILDVRYDAMLDTILITNQEKDRFSDSVGLSVVSRIHECGKVIECDWDSFRGRRAPVMEAA